MKSQPVPATHSEWQRIDNALRDDIADASPSRLARHLNTSREALDQILLEHRHQTATQALAALRANTAASLLREGGTQLDRVATDAGFSGLVALNRALRAHFGVNAHAIDQLPGSTAFDVELPAQYRNAETLAYLARDPASNNVTRCDEASVMMAVRIGNGPLQIKLSLRGRQARVELGAPLANDSVLPCLNLMRRLLGLAAPTRALARRAETDAQVQRLISGRTGLTVHQTASTWDALVWAVLGQQISLHAAYSLLRALSEAAGFDAGNGLFTLPVAARVADMSEAQLRTCKLSRAKATTLGRLAGRVADGSLDLAALASGSAVTARATLLAQHGIGPWTANYVMMRGLGFADCAPVGDAGLRRALRRFFDLAHAPRDDEMETLMAPFAPHRSLATFHLWRRFDDALPTS